MIQYIITFFIVQCMFTIIGVFGGVEIGTFEAGMLCFLSQFVGVVVCAFEYLIRSKKCGFGL